MIIPVIIATIPQSKIKTLSFDEEKEIVKSTVKKVTKCLKKRPLILYNASTFNIVSELTDKDFLVYNPKIDSKLSYSIKLATEWILHNYSMNVTGIMFFLAQQPLVPEKVINEEIKLFRNNENHFVMSKYNDKYGYPIIVGKNYFHYLLRLEENLTGKHFISRIHNIISVEGDKNCIETIDTNEKFKEVKNLF